MQDFSSEELKNAIQTPSSITDNSLNKIDLTNLKDDLKLSVLLKDKTLLKIYELASFTKSNTLSSNENLKNLLILIKDYYANKFKNDSTKNLTIRKSFDIILISLDNLIINGIDLDSRETNTLLLSFLETNFL